MSVASTTLPAVKSVPAAIVAGGAIPWVGLVILRRAIPAITVVANAWRLRGRVEAGGRASGWRGTWRATGRRCWLGWRYWGRDGSRLDRIRVRRRHTALASMRSARARRAGDEWHARRDAQREGANADRGERHDAVP
jgi:hypothetical protein